MSVSGFQVVATIPVSDLARAREFYEGVLGLAGGEDKPDGGVLYPSDEGSAIHIYPSPDNAGRSGATLAAWRIEDVAGAVKRLAAKGVRFERYETEAIRTDERGITRLGDADHAWFKDPDGNLLAIEEP